MFIFFYFYPALIGGIFFTLILILLLILLFSFRSPAKHPLHHPSRLSLVLLVALRFTAGYRFSRGYSFIAAIILHQEQEQCRGTACRGAERERETERERGDSTLFEMFAFIGISNDEHDYTMKEFHDFINYDLMIT
jgi:hypothetical protein